MFTLPVYYFKKKPGLVLGIAATGYSIGGMVIPIILQYLVEAYGWRGATIVMSALSLNICVCGAVARPVEEKDGGKETVDHGVTRSDANAEKVLPSTVMAFTDDPGKTKDAIPFADGSCAEKTSDGVQGAMVGSTDCERVLSVPNTGEGVTSDATVPSNVEHMESKSHTSKTKDLRSSFKNMFRNVPFILLNLEVFMYSAGLHIVKAHMKSAVVYIGGFSDREGTYALTAMNGGSLLGSIGTGLFLFRFPKIDTILVLIVIMTICGTAMILMPFVSVEYYAILALCIVVGMTFSPHGYVISIIHEKMLGLDDVTLAFGIFLFFMGIGGFIGPALAGYAYDMTGEYSYSLYIAGAFYIIGNILVLQPCIANLRKRKPLEKKEENDETAMAHDNPSFLFEVGSSPTGAVATDCSSVAPEVKRHELSTMVAEETQHTKF
jgi:MCP family monocarboxylic acid transporter-like MFS transporter 14